jgi:hypothetical protein
MSYCRWSSDNWKSDVYIYASHDGLWTTHVAAKRIVGPVPEEPTWKLLLKDKKLWLRKYKAVNEFIETADRVPIDLPHSGETFKDNSPKGCIDTLRMLQGIGYHVPSWAIEELEEESRVTQGEEKC